MYRVRRSDRARRVRVTVDATRGVEVVLPRRAAEREAAAAIRELRPWIEKRLAAVAAARERAALLAPPGTVPYLGTALRLSHCPPPRPERRHQFDCEAVAPFLARVRLRANQ